MFSKANLTENKLGTGRWKEQNTYQQGADRGRALYLEDKTLVTIEIKESGFH